MRTKVTRPNVSKDQEMSIIKRKLVVPANYIYLAGVDLILSEMIIQIKTYPAEAHMKGYIVTDLSMGAALDRSYYALNLNNFHAFSPEIAAEVKQTCKEFIQIFLARYYEDCVKFHQLYKTHSTSRIIAMEYRLPYLDYLREFLTYQFKGTVRPRSPITIQADKIRVRNNPDQFKPKNQPELF